MKLLLTFLLFCSAIFFSNNLLAEENKAKFVHVPDEYETTTALGVGMANSGSVALGGLESVKINPAMLALGKYYTVFGGYHWPTKGREFYQAGVIDSKTSSLAAGLLYNGFAERYEKIAYEDKKDKDTAFIDSPIKRRLFLGLAQLVGNVAVGLNGQFVEAYDLDSLEDETTKGISVGLGAIGYLTSNIRIGISAENLANKKIKEYAPRAYRGGVAYVYSDLLGLHLDYLQRERVSLENPKTVENLLALYLGQTSMDNQDDTNDLSKSPEQLVTASFSLKPQSYIRLLGAYGQSVGEDEQRKTLAGGAALENDKFSLSYSLNKPFLSDQATHQAVNLSLTLTM